MASDLCVLIAELCIIYLSKVDEQWGLWALITELKTDHSEWEIGLLNATAWWEQLRTH